ncbi:MAG: hypothetical protein AAF800_10540 [Planctomycetota bacterium]
MAQRKFHEKVETWIVVTVISVLVWLYAEATVLQQPPPQRIQVNFVEPTGGYALSPDTPANVLVTFRASSSQIQDFRDLTTLPLTVELDPANVQTVQTRTVILGEALLRAGLGELGITDLEVEPPTFGVTLRPLRDVSLPVVVDPGELNVGSSVPVADPASVTVTAPLDVVEAIAGQPVVAMLAEAPAPSEGVERQRVATNVPLVFPDALDLGGRWTRASDRTARVNYTLADDNATTVVSRVPLYVSLPVDLQLRYTLAPADQTNFLSDVELQGPAEAIRRIEQDIAAGELPVRAELTLTDLTRIDQPTASERPTVLAPPGVTPVQLPDAMTITLRRRTPPGS